MIKKFLTIGVGALLFSLFSCGPAHNDDNTNVDHTSLSPSYNGNDTSNGKFRDTTGVNTSSVNR
jgi:hypothetical protein